MSPFFPGVEAMLLRERDEYDAGVHPDGFQGLFGGRDRQILNSGGLQGKGRESGCTA
jgi:hypothetical protein